MAVTRTQTFQPAKISVAARTSSPASRLSGSVARTAPAPTRRTTTPARRSNVSSQLASLGGRSTGTVAPIKLRSGGGGGGSRSILGQFWDLAKNLPQGLVGFGKDVLTDVVATPRVLIDLAKDQELRSLSDYLPASTGMLKSFGNTAYDITHPQEFIDAYNEGRIVSKVVEDVGNVAIVGGAVGKALGAGAATGVMSASEAAAVPYRFGVGARLSGRSLEEAAQAGVKGAAEAVAKPVSLADVAQFGGRELAEYTLPKRGLAGMVQSSSPELAGRLQTAGNVVQKYARYGEQAGNVPALPYQYAGRGINRLAEAAGLEGGVSGTLRRAATRVAPEIMFRSTPEGQITRRAMAEAERVGTRAQRFVLQARERAQQLGLDQAEQEALGLMIDVPNLGKGLEHLDDAQLSEYLDNEFAYGGVELDQRPTVATVRKVMEYRDRTLPAAKLAAMDEVQDVLVGIAQDRTQRMLAPEPAKVEVGTPAELPAGVPHQIAGEPPGVTPGRPIVGDTSRGLNPEQLGNDLRESQVAEYIGTRERRRDIVQRRWETTENRALREERIMRANDALMDELPPPPDPRVAFRQGRQFQSARTGDSIARRRWEQAQRALDQAVNEYIKLSEGGPSPAVERAGREVERLTQEAERIRGMVERNQRRVDAATALSRASGEVEPGAARVLDETPASYATRQAEQQVMGTLTELQALNEQYGLNQNPTPEIRGVGKEPQQIRARAKEIGQQAAYEAEGAVDALAGGDRPQLPPKGGGGGEYDWYRSLDAPTRRRLQREGWMSGSGGTRGTTPDVIAEAINRNLGTNLSVDAAMSRWVDAVRRYWDAKAGKGDAIIDQVADELQMPRENVAAAIRGRIADYGPLLEDRVTSNLSELRGAYEALDPETQASFDLTVQDMLANPSSYDPSDFGDVLNSYFPDLDVMSPEGAMAAIDGMVDLPEMVDWLRGGSTVDYPLQVRAKVAARGEVRSRQLGRLEGAVTGAKQQLTDTTRELNRVDHQLTLAEGAAARGEAKAERGIERASAAEEAARPVQGPKLAETYKPDVEAYDPWRRRTGTTKTGEKTRPMSRAERARVRQGQQIERAHKARADANKLRRSIERYNEQIAGARDELSRSFQTRLHEDVNLPAAQQMRNAVASGGKALGNITGTGDSAAINGVIATIGDKYGVYDDFVEALDEATFDKGEALVAAEVAQVVDDVLRDRRDVVLDGPDRTLLDDAIGRDTLLDDINTTMRNETDGGRRLNSPYRIFDVINAHAWNMPAESRTKVRAAFERWQVRRANTMARTYNQWSAAVPARFRPAVQAGQRQISALIDIAESRNKAVPGSGDVYLDIAESTMSTLGQLVEQGYDPVHLVGGSPARQTSAASTATGGGLGQKTQRGQRTRRTGLRQLSLDAYARVEAEEATTWINNQRNTYLEQQLGRRADSMPEVQEALAAWAEEHHGETMPPRTLAKIAADAGFVPIVDKDVAPHTVLVPKRVYDVLTPARYNNVALRALGRTNQAFKTWVLPFSPKWQIGNILGNVIQASVHGGVGPLELVRTMNRIRRYEGGVVALWRNAGLPEWTRAEIANHGLTMDEYRIYRNLDDKPPRTPIGKFSRLSFRVNEFVDNLTRSSTDLAALARGESTDQALQTTIRSLGDYSRMSTFERKVIREVIPFYAWLRHSTVATLRLPITSPARAAFLFHLADIYRDPEAQGELFGSRIPLGDGGLLNLGTINPLQDITSFINPGELIGPNLSPTIKTISSLGLGLDLNKMAALTRPEDTAMLDPYGRPKTTAPIAQLFRDPLAGAGEILWQASQQSPTTLRNIRDLALGDDVRYGGTGYRVGDLVDKRKRSISTLLRALNLPSIDQPSRS